MIGPLHGRREQPGLRDVEAAPEARGRVHVVSGHPAEHRVDGRRGPRLLLEIPRVLQERADVEHLVADVIGMVVPVPRFKPADEATGREERLEEPQRLFRHGAQARQGRDDMAGEMPSAAPLGIVLVLALVEDDRIAEEAVVVLVRLEIADPGVAVGLRERAKVVVEIAGHRRIGGTVERGLGAAGGVAIAAEGAPRHSHRLDIGERPRSQPADVERGERNPFGLGGRVGQAPSRRCRGREGHAGKPAAPSAKNPVAQARECGWLHGDGDHIPLLAQRASRQRVICCRASARVGSRPRGIVCRRGA